MVIFFFLKWESFVLTSKEGENSAAKEKEKIKAGTGKGWGAEDCDPGVWRAQIKE